MQTLVLASHNKHKADEIRQLLKCANLTDLEITTPDPKVSWIEDGNDFVTNATIKAKAVAQAHPGKAILSDDSGIEVHALDGRPGIHSARFSETYGAGWEFEGSDMDSKNNSLLLKMLKDKQDRRARFVCCLCFLTPDGQAYHFQGYFEGQIALETSGGEGFGYDPLFIPDGHQISVAQLGAEFKNLHSHRSKALTQWLEWMKASSS